MECCRYLLGYNSLLLATDGDELEQLRKLVISRIIGRDLKRWEKDDLKNCFSLLDFEFCENHAVADLTAKIGERKERPFEPSE